MAEVIARELRCEQCEIQRSIQDFIQCSQCRPAGKPTPYYCKSHCFESSCGHAVECGIAGHQSCWQSHLPRVKSEAHKPADAAKAFFVDLIMYSETNKAAQKLRHERDQKAQWFYVNLGGLEDQYAMLQISERFRQLCDPGTQRNMWNQDQYPSLVCFIGNTGVGKSTLVNAMMLMGRLEGQDRSAHVPSPRPGQSASPANHWDMGSVVDTRNHGPVTRSGNLDDVTEPTSSGVHLYRDPCTTKVKWQLSRESESSPSSRSHDSEAVPILFADCEGFAGGTMRTNAERSRDSIPGASSSRTRSPSTSGSNPREPSGSSRGRGMSSRYMSNELLITAPEFKEAGKEAAEQLYARFLYAFSDVVVFVTKEDQQLSNDMRRLLEWAASAVNNSINDLPKKTLIVVRNMPTLHHPDYYDEAFLKRSLFGSMENIWEHSKQLAAFKRAHDKRTDLRQRKIHNNKDFLNLFFQNVEVCYIPMRTSAPTDETYQQYRSLRERIIQAAEAGQQARAASWTRYDVPTFSHLIARAFNHFAQQPGPFDFYKAAKKDNPTPRTMSDHLANFLRHIRTTRSSLDTFSSVVAACLVCWMHREFRQAVEPKETFDKTLQHFCMVAISAYRDKYQRCAFVFPDGSTCRASRLTHPEHISSDVKAVKVPGIFDPSDFQEDPSETIFKIGRTFIHAFNWLCSGPASGSVLKLAPREEVSRYRAEVLASDEMRRTQFWKHVKSNKTCFACLQLAPDHVLPCGHGYCETCIEEFGEPYPSIRYCIEMRQCILCGATWEGSTQQLIHRKPTHAGVRLLALDGGGIRGVVELALLEKVQHRIGLQLPAHAFFDLIMGTSTGGILALGLGMTEYNLSEITEEFVKLAEKTFKLDRNGRIPITDFVPVMMALRIWESRYKTSPLEAGLKALFGSEQAMFGGTTHTRRQRPVRVAVTSTSNGQACIFSNYNRAKFEDAPDFEREDDPASEMRVWEAALATSAAPYYFKPYKKDRPSCSKTYVDGALHANMPAVYALEETERIWPSRSDRETRVDALVSVGTAIQKREFSFPNVLEIGGFKDVCEAFFNSLNTEATWATFQAGTTYDATRHHRLNAHNMGRSVHLDQWKEMQRLAEAVDTEYHQLGPSPSSLALAIEEVAYRLTASLFFFEPTSPSPGNSHHAAPYASGMRRHRISGQIWCRLESGSAGLAELVQRVVGFFWKEDSEYRQEGLVSWVPIPVRSDWKRAVRVDGEHVAIPCDILTSQPDSKLTIAVSLRSVSSSSVTRYGTLIEEKRKIPISGFPAPFRELMSKFSS